MQHFFECEHLKLCLLDQENLGTNDHTYQALLTLPIADPILQTIDSLTDHN